MMEPPNPNTKQTNTPHQWLRTESNRWSEPNESSQSRSQSNIILDFVMVEIALLVKIHLLQIDP